MTEYDPLGSNDFVEEEHSNPERLFDAGFQGLQSYIGPLMMIAAATVVALALAGVFEPK